MTLVFEPRAHASLFLLIFLLGATTRGVLRLAEAQLDLKSTIQELSKWPCADYSWQDCPQVVPHGGYEPAKWYEVTQWQAYTVLADDGETKGRDAYVYEAFQLLAALEDRENARITVMQPFVLSPDQWPLSGYPVQRDLVIKADPSCGALIPGGECVIECSGQTLFVVTKDGTLDMRGLTLQNGGGRLGAFIYIAPGGSGRFEDVKFFKGASAVGGAVGGAVMLTNADRGGVVPHNITFKRCNFTENAVSDGNGGALWIKQAGLGWVIFDECTFTSNQATKGSGGAVFSLGGRVIFAACNFTDNTAEAGGGLMLQGGGLVGGGIFTGNRATARSGGSIFMTGRNGLVQDTLFRRNSAAVEAGAVFVYGDALFLTNSFVSNTAAYLYPDVYICSDANKCTAYNRETKEFYEVPYEPFARQGSNPPVLVPEGVSEESDAGASGDTVASSSMK